MTLAEITRDVRFWQRLLNFAGYGAGKVDGIAGPKTRAAAARWMADAEAAKTAYGTYDERSETNIATLLPSVQKQARLWLKEAKAKAAQLGVEVRVICGCRTYAEQDALYAKRPRVTTVKGGGSMHNFGLAWDFGLFRGKDYLGDSPHYATLGAIARNISGLTWGGDWKSFVDQPHIQNNKFASTAKARAAFEK